jgi:hypothetical protein
MAVEERNAAVAAAKRNGVSVGEWLALAIRTRVQFEREARAPTLIPPVEPASLSEAEQMARLMTELHASLGPPPVKAARETWKRVLCRFDGLTPLVVPRLRGGRTAEPDGDQV